MKNLINKNSFEKKYLINLTYEEIKILLGRMQSSVSRKNEIIEKINQAMEGITKELSSETSKAYSKGIEEGKYQATKDWKRILKIPTPNEAEAYSKGREDLKKQMLKNFGKGNYMDKEANKVDCRNCYIKGFNDCMNKLTNVSNVRKQSR